VRQSNVQATGRASIHRSQVGNASRTTHVNANNSVNVHNRDWDVGNVEGVYVGEEHAYVRGEEHRVWVGDGDVHVYEDHDAWRVAAGVATAVAIGTMIATLPTYYSTVVVYGSSYYYSDGYYYSEVYSGGEVVYQVVPPPLGAFVTELPASCYDYYLGNELYYDCDGYFYQPQGSGYVVVDL
jgi:hypothetical protein